MWQANVQYKVPAKYLNTNADRKCRAIIILTGQSHISDQNAQF